LAEIGDRESVRQYIGAESAGQRLSALLALRHWADPAITAFLTDSEPKLVVEASRSIYDLPII